MRHALLEAIVILVLLATIFLNAISTTSGETIIENSWTQVAPLPGFYYSLLGATAANGKIYFIEQNSTEQYDPVTNMWTQLAPLPIFHPWSTIVACQNKIYVICGPSEVPRSMGEWVNIPTQVYDPATNTWENKSSFPVTLLEYKANVVNNKIYVISGGKLAGLGIVDPSETNYVYDPASDSWSKMAPIPTPVEGYASAVLDNKIYIIGGGPTPVKGGVEKATNIVQIFDPKTNTWSIGNPIPTGVYGAAACSTLGLLAPKQIYVVGGNLFYNTIGTSASLGPQGSSLNQVYDPETGNWSLATSLPEIRWFLSLVNVNDILYVVGGVNSSDLVPNIQATQKYIPIEYENAMPSIPSTNSGSTDSASQTTDPFIYNDLLILSTIIACIIVGFLVYFKKHKHQN